MDNTNTFSTQPSYNYIDIDLFLIIVDVILYNRRILVLYYIIYTIGTFYSCFMVHYC